MCRGIICKDWLWDYELLYIVFGIILGLLMWAIYDVCNDYYYRFKRWRRKKMGTNINPYYVLEQKLIYIIKELDEIKKQLKK